MAGSWSPGGWCEGCGRYFANAGMYARQDGGGVTWRCIDDVPEGYRLAPGMVGTWACR